MKILTQTGRIAIIGAVRQELLSGIKKPDQFDIIQKKLYDFPDEILSEQDYEEAARMNNTCHSHGIQGSHTDFLICAIAMRRRLSIYSLDNDFENYSKWIPVRLHRSNPQKLKKEE